MAKGFQQFEERAKLFWIQLVCPGSKRHKGSITGQTIYIKVVVCQFSRVNWTRCACIL